MMFSLKRKSLENGHMEHMEHSRNALICVAIVTQGMLIYRSWLSTTSQ